MKKLVAILLTFLLVLTGCNTIEVTKVEDENKTDNIKFSSEYKSVSKNNIYKYSTYDNIIDAIENKTEIIYLGFPSCVLCKEITPILNDAASSKGLDSILYYDFKDIRENNTLEYQKLLEKISDYISDDEDEEKRISAPTVIFTKNGNIVGIYKVVINNKSEELLSTNEKDELNNYFKSLIDKMLIEDEEYED